MNQCDSKATRATPRIWRAEVLAAALLLLLPATVWAQRPRQETTATEAVDTMAYTFVEEMSELPSGGGSAAIVALIQKRVRIPPIL